MWGNKVKTLFVSIALLVPLWPKCLCTIDYVSLYKPAMTLHACIKHLFDGQFSSTSSISLLLLPFFVFQTIICIPIRLMPHLVGSPLSTLTQTRIHIRTLAKQFTFNPSTRLNLSDNNKRLDHGRILAPKCTESSKTKRCYFLSRPRMSCPAWCLLYSVWMLNWLNP